MKRNLTILLCFATTIAFAQAPKIQWERSLGGGGEDIAKSIRMTPDHGYIVAGYSSSLDGDVTGLHGLYDAWIVKLDSLGNIKWERTYGGSNYDEAVSICLTSNGGYIFTGRSWSNDGDVTDHHGLTTEPDVWVVKLSAEGNIEWERSYGGTGYDEPYDILQTDDGGYIVGASAWSNDGDVTGNHGTFDYWIVKLASEGNIEWEKCYGGSGWDEPCSILQLNGGGYFVAGYSVSGDGDISNHHGHWAVPDVWIIRLNKNGRLVRERSLGNYENQEPYGACFSNDGGYVVVGGGYDFPKQGIYTHGYYDQFPDLMIMKTNRRGIIDSACLMGGSANDVGLSIAATRDGGYIAVGETFSGDGDVTGHHCGGENTICYTSDYWVVKVDSLLRLQWEKALGGGNNESACSVQQTDDEGYIIAGQSDTFFKDGDVTGNHGGDDFWIVKLAPDHIAAIIASTTQAKASDTNLLLYPNPSNAQVNLSFPFSNNIITISDLFGRELMQWKIENGNLKMIDLNFLQQGVYMVEIKDEKGALLASEKLFKQ